MTIEQYLRGKVDFNVNDSTLGAILFDRGISAGVNVSTTTLEQRELCLADLYVFLATSSTSASGEYESDGGWQHQKSAKNVVNRAALLQMAKAIYDKYGVDTSTITIGKVVFDNLY